MVKTEIKLEKEFYFCILDNKSYEVYDSDTYKLNELDILNLIKICYIERRYKALGKKILEMYKTVYENNFCECQEKLERIGIIENGKREPTTIKRPRRR